MNYIATFFTHSGAIKYKKQFANNGIHVELRPVPRELSSSCGVAGVFCLDPGRDQSKEGKPASPEACTSGPCKAESFVTEELEKLYIIGPNGYELLFENE